MSRLFGTNGVRWVVGDRTPEFPARLGTAAGAFYGNGKRVAVGLDTRTSSDMIFNAVASGLMSAGCHVVRLGIVPTPAVQYAVRHLGLDGGAMVTASHNPPEFNGLKLFAADGTELSRQDEERVEALVSDQNLRGAGWDSVGAIHENRQVQGLYKQSIIKLAGACARKVSVTVDCANATAAEFSPPVLSGIGCTVQTINSRHDGAFPGRKPEPVRENLGGLMAQVKLHGSDLGIAHDGDADRAMFIDEKGDFVTGDQSLAIFAVDAVGRSGGGTVVVPVTTSMTVQDAVETAGGNIEYTAVGSPIIARRMMANGAVLGGEGNGGTLFPEHLLCRDGIMAAARMSEIVSRGTSLSELAGALPKYHTRNAKVAVKEGMKARAMEAVRNDAGGRVSELDGVKSTYDDYWVLVRPSGTEPIMRITVESKDPARSEAILADRVKFLEEVISRLS